MTGPYNLLWTNAAGDQNWSTAGNWYDTVNNVTASNPPATGDTAVFGSGNSSVTLGLSQSSVNLATLSISSQFQGQIGTTGTSLTISVASGSSPNFICQGSGAYVNIIAGSSGITNTSIINGNVNLNGGTFTTVACSGGIATIGASAVVTTCYPCGGAIIAAYNATPFTLVEASGSSLITSRNATNVTTSNGATVQFMGTSAIGTAAKIYGPSRINYQSPITIPAVYLFTSGTIDAKGSVYSGVNVTNLYKVGPNGVGYFANSPVPVTTTTQVFYGTAN